MAFYNLSKPFASRGPWVYGDPKQAFTYRPLEWGPNSRFADRTCPIARKHQPPIQREGPLEITLLKTTRLNDFMWTVYSECVVSDKVKGILQSPSFTGHDLRRVSCVDAAGRLMPDAPLLWELVVIGLGGEAAEESGIGLHFACPSCDLKVYTSFRHGIIVDEQQWDRSDLFTVNGYPNLILITPQVAKLVIDQRLTGCALIPSHELRWDEDIARPEEYAFD